MDCLDIRIIQINRIFGRRESCLFDIFATLANYNSLDYLFCFSHEFDFKISYKNIEEGKTIGESIKQNDSNCFDLFFKAYGYKIKYCYIKKIDEEIKFIKESLNLKQPCIVHFDSFYNTVDPLYNKVHNNHCLIVVGITNSGIYTVDPYFNTKSFIPLKLLKKASSFYIYFEKEGEENNRNRIISEILSNKYCTNKEFLQKPSKMYIDLQYLSNLFEHNFDKNGSIPNFV